MPPEAVPINASVASTGLGLRYIGQHCYGYSGDFASDANNDTEYLNFTSGSGYIVGTCQFHYGQNTDDDYAYRIEFNDITVCNYVTTGGRDGQGSEPDSSIPIVIPPFTKVVMSCQNISSVTGRRQNVIFVGRVYE